MERPVEWITNGGCYLPTVKEGVKLIGFCDASMKAYATVVYLKDHNQVCSLIASKRRVSRAQVQTIPRLKLLGAILLSRLIANVKEIFGCIVSV